MTLRRLTNLMPRRTVRFRLTALYSSLFLASGVVLLAIAYVLVARDLQRPPLASHGIPSVYKGSIPSGPISPAVLTAKAHSADLHQLLVGSSIALAVMTVGAVLLGWVVAGRVLRPLRTITTATQHISEESLDQRLALDGPRDELKDLGDTIDGLLSRLQIAFEAQRNFVANAAHELRTPLTVERAMLQVALADPTISFESLRTVCEEVLENGKQQEELIDALLTLARSQRGLEHRQPVDLAGVVADVVDQREARATASGLRLDVSLMPASISGDSPLLERLVANLVDNATHYNVDGGMVRVAIERRLEATHLLVSNTGPVVSEDEIARLIEPFQQAAPGRAGTHEGLGLGLSIVLAIARAHGADLDVRGRDGGGLDVQITFDELIPSGRLASRNQPAN